MNTADITTTDMATAELSQREHRRRTLISAKIRYGGSVTVEVLVRDITEGGARLKPLQALLVPDTFELEIDGHRADCTVVWRRGVELGVSFATPLRAAPSTRQRVTALTERPSTIRRRVT